MKKQIEGKKRGRKVLPDDEKKGKLTLSINRETIAGAKDLPGSLSARVEAFLAWELAVAASVAASAAQKDQGCVMW
jgi:hypothetical protein